MAHDFFTPQVCSEHIRTALKVALLKGNGNVARLLFDEATLQGEAPKEIVYDVTWLSGFAVPPILLDLLDQRFKKRGQD